MNLGLVCCSCGLCSTMGCLCEQCLISTLRGNGINENKVSEIRGLKKQSPSHGNGFEFSELYWKLKTLIK